MNHRTTLLLVSLFALPATGSAVTVLATGFTGVNTSDTSAPYEATGVTWTTDGISAPSSSLVFYDPAAPATTFGFIATGPSPADNIQVARNIETAGPWATSFTFTTTTGIDLVNFNLDFRAISATGGNQSAAKSALFSLQVFQGATSLGSFSDSVTDPGGSTAAGDTANIDLSSLANLQAGTAYTFVLTVSTSGTSGNNVAIDNLALNGTLIPEPSSSLLLAAASLLLLKRRRA